MGQVLIELALKMDLDCSNQMLVTIVVPLFGSAQIDALNVISLIGITHNDYLSPLFNTSKNTLAFCSFNIFQLLFPCQSNHCPKMNRPGLVKLELLE